MSELAKLMAQQLGPGYNKPKPEEIGTPVTPPDGAEFVSSEDIMAELRGEVKPETPQEPLRIKTKFGDLTPEELAQRLEDAEEKRRGFQSEADRVRYELQAFQQAQAKQAQQVQQPAGPKKPDMDTYLKEIDDTDPRSELKVMAKYYEDLRAYENNELERKINERINRERQEQEVLRKAQALADKDPAFKNPDGTPNLPAIEAFLNQVTSDWAGLYDLKSGKATTQPERAVNGISPENMTVVTPKFAGTTSVASSGSGGATESKSRMPDWMKDITRLTGGKLDLPLGVKFVK